MTPLVYLPGLDGSAELLFLQEERLGERFRIVKVPWRTEGPFEHEDLVSDVLETMDREGISRATVLAESFGGTVGLLLALTHPERIERLVLFNTFAYYPNRPLIRWGRFLAGLGHPDLVQALRMLIDTPVLALEGVEKPARKRFLEVAYGQPLPAYVRRLELVEAFDVRDRLREIDVPTLVVASENDRVVWSDAGRLLAERIPNARLRILPHQGHAALLTPAVSLAEILDEM